MAVSGMVILWNWASWKALPAAKFQRQTVTSGWRRFAGTRSETRKIRRSWRLWVGTALPFGSANWNRRDGKIHWIQLRSHWTISGCKTTLCQSLTNLWRGKLVCRWLQRQMCDGLQSHPQSQQCGWAFVLPNVLPFPKICHLKPLKSPLKSVDP